MQFAKTPPHLITLILLTALSTLTLNMFLPSLANIAEEFDTPYSIVSFALGGYLAVTAVVQLIVGPMADRYGRRPIMLASLVLFSLASFFCVIATDIWMFLTFRMLQAGIISGYVISLAVVRDTKPEREAASLIGYISMSMALAPMLGPMLGGVLDAVFGWRANFIFYACAGLMLWLNCLLDLGETRQGRSETDSARKNGFLLLLKEPLFWCCSLCSASSIGGFYMFLTGAPLVAKNQFRVSSAELGFYIGTITAGFMLGSFVAGKFGPRFAPTTMMLTGRLVASFGLVMGAVFLGLGFSSPIFFFGCTIFVGLGNGITLPSASASAMSINPELTGTAAGLGGAITVAIGALLSMTTGAVLPVEQPALTLLILMLAAATFGVASVAIAVYFLRKSGPQATPQ